MSIQCTKQYKLTVAGGRAYDEYWSFDNADKGTGLINGSPCSAAFMPTVPGILGNGILLQKNIVPAFLTSGTGFGYQIPVLAFDPAVNPAFFATFWLKLSNPITGTYGNLQVVNNSGPDYAYFEVDWDIPSGLWRLYGFNGNITSTNHAFVFAPGWYFVVLQYVPGTKLADLWVNGVHIGSVAVFGSGIPADTSGGFTIYQTSNEPDFVIDELGFGVNYKLTQGNINWLYNGGLGRTYPEIKNVGTA